MLELSITSSDCMTFNVNEDKSITIEKTSSRDGKFFKITIEGRTTLSLLHDALGRAITPAQPEPTGGQSDEA